MVRIVQTERFGKFLIRALTFGDVNSISGKTIALNEKGMSIDVGKMRFLTLKMGIVKPKLTDKQINNLNEITAQELYRRILVKTGYSINLFQKGAMPNA